MFAHLDNFYNFLKHHIRLACAKKWDQPTNRQDNSKSRKGVSCQIMACFCQSAYQNSHPCFRLYILCWVCAPGLEVLKANFHESLGLNPWNVRFVPILSSLPQCWHVMWQHVSWTLANLSFAKMVAWTTCRAKDRLELQASHGSNILNLKNIKNASQDMMFSK